ncbi:MAG: aromatic ring-hydroxylating dioxygenase subunit alpha [Burkholderiaceae bacterium]
MKGTEMDARHQLSQLLATREQLYSLPQAFYGDEAFHQLDIALIWNRSWIFAAPECVIPATGNWFTLDVGTSSIVIVRGAAGEVRALYNTCRHRGSKLCVGQQGKVARLVCPYHQWTYGLDGQLLFARDMGPTFDAKQFPLKQAHCRVVGGLVYICLADQAPDIEPFAQTVEPYMQPHGLKNAKVAFTQTLIERANWKLVLENNRECYHCSANHPELLRTLSEYDDVNDPRMAPAFAARIKAKGAQWDTQGLPHVSQMSPDKRFRVVRLPLASGTSMTMDGALAVKGGLLGGLQDADLGSVRLLSLPNNWNHLQADHALAFRVLPIGPQETMVTTWWLVNQDAREGIDYDVDNLKRVWFATNDQDRMLAENNQAGINSKAYEPGPYSPTIEFGVQNFIDWYTSEMSAGLGESRPAITLRVA